MARPPSAYRLSRLAYVDLESIYDYTRQTWSARQADKYYAQLVAEFSALADGSKRGRDAELGQGVMRALVGSHVIFYQVSDSRIDIIRILHEAMDAPRHFKP
jgi:toxin ParE1/3/4